MSNGLKKSDGDFIFQESPYALALREGKAKFDEVDLLSPATDKEDEETNA